MSGIRSSSCCCTLSKVLFTSHPQPPLLFKVKDITLKKCSNSMQCPRLLPRLSLTTHQTQLLRQLHSCLTLLLPSLRLRLCLLEFKISVYLCEKSITTVLSALRRILCVKSFCFTEADYHYQYLLYVI